MDVEIQMEEKIHLWYLGYYLSYMKNTLDNELQP